MLDLSVPQTRSQQLQVFLLVELYTWSRAFIPDDLVPKPLGLPYRNPFRVISVHDKTLKIDRLGRFDTVSTIRVSLTHVDDSVFSSSSKYSEWASYSSSDRKVACPARFPDCNKHATYHT